MSDQTFEWVTSAPVTSAPTEMSVTKTYSLTTRHIGMVAEMSAKASERTGRNVSQGEIIRTAIELLQEEFEAVFSLVTITPEGLAALSKSEGE